MADHKTTRMQDLAAAMMQRVTDAQLADMLHAAETERQAHYKALQDAGAQVDRCRAEVMRRFLWRVEHERPAGRGDADA